MITISQIMIRMHSQPLLQPRDLIQRECLFPLRHELILLILIIQPAHLLLLLINIVIHPLYLHPVLLHLRGLFLPLQVLDLEVQFLVVGPQLVVLEEKLLALALEHVADAHQVLVLVAEGGVGGLGVGGVDEVRGVVGGVLFHAEHLDLGLEIHDLVLLFF